MHKFEFTIAYADTDAGGIVYHARYIEIAERARTQMFLDAERRGAPSFMDHDDGIWVIHSLDIKYIKPLMLGQTFVIESKTIHLTSARVTVEQKFVFNGEECAVLKINVVFIDGKTHRPKRIPDEWLPYFKISE